MEIRLLGSVEVIGDDDVPIVVRGLRLQTLLAALALEGGQPVPADRLVDNVWGDHPPASPTNALQRHVSELRRLLGTGAVQRRGNGYALCIDPSSVDIHRFDALVAGGHQALAGGDIVRGRELLDEALALWRGDALVELSDVQFARPEISRMTEARIGALEARIDADLALGENASLVPELDSLVASHPLREHFWAQLMLALVRSGRQAEALRAYQSARSVLGEELGLEPSQELRGLEAAIIAQEVDVSAEDARTSERRRTNLPAPLTSLIGRRDELHELGALLETSRLITIVGPGGAGKTRLALELARSCHERTDVDVWLVELAGVDDPDGVAPAIAAALELSQDADHRAAIARIAQFLSGRPALLVLDNCEHLVDQAASVARDLLGACPLLRLAATSREPLAVTGEVVRPIPPLPIRDAMSLFVERAQAVARIGGPQPDLQDEVLLEAICVHLDGLPLAIELAAARMRAMPIAILAAQLDDRFQLLTRGDRSGPARQQTLRATVDWSYDLLFDDERRIFNRLSVFTNGCTLDAARAVCSDNEITPDDVDELVARLVDKSLVVARFESSSVRYDMLQTLLHYGRDRLGESEDATRVMRVHTDYFAALCERGLAAQRGEDQRSWLQTVTADIDNIRAALAALIDRHRDAARAQCAAGALGWFWWLTGRAAEGSRWIAAASACPGEVPELVRARVLAWSLYFRSANPEIAVAPDDAVDALADDALRVYRQEGALDELADMGLILAVMYSTRGNPPRAQQLVLDTEALLAARDATPRVAALRPWVSARRALYQGRYAEAEAGLLDSSVLLRAVGDEALYAFTAVYLGRLALLRDDNRTSVAVLERGLALARELGLLGLADMLTTDLGDALAVGGDVGRARALLAEARTSGRDVMFLPGHGRTLIALALLERREGNTKAAIEAANDALDLVVAGNNRDGIAHCLAILGFVAETSGDISEARTYHMRGLAYANETREPRFLALALDGLAGIAQADHDGFRAGRLLGAAESLRRSVTWRVGWSVASAERGDAERITRAAIALVGADAFAEAFAIGAADPDTVLEEVRAAAR